MNEQWLPSEHGTESGPLQQRVARGLTWTIIDTWGTQILGLIVFAILANLLIPEHFGLVALAAVFVSFAQLLVDQGLGDALIQRAKVTRRQIDTAFWVAVATGSLLAVVGFLTAGLISTALGEPRLEPILQALSLTFFIAAFSSIQLALLRREMLFRSLAIRKLAAVAGGGVIGIILAFNGAGAWALVAQQLSAATISVATLWTVSPWRPGFQLSREDFRSLFGFGISIVGGDILNFLSRNVDKLLIGTYLGLTPLGLYAVGYRVLDTTQQLLVSFARRLAFPLFARLQGDIDRLRRTYKRVTQAVSVVIMPGYVGMALVANEAIVVIFGPQWAESGNVAAILFLIGPVLTGQLFNGALLNGVGHPEITFRIRLVTTIVNVVGFLTAVYFFQDIVAVAAAYVIRGYLMLPLIVYWTSKYANVDVRSQLSGLIGPAVATAVMAIAVIAVKLVLANAGLSNGVLLTIEVLIGAVTFFAALFVVDRPLLRDVTRFALQAAPGGRAVARVLNVQLPAAGGRGRRAAARRRGEAGVADPAAAEEVVTEGSSVAAESMAALGGITKDAGLGDA